DNTNRLPRELFNADGSMCHQRHSVREMQPESTSSFNRYSGIVAINGIRSNLVLFLLWIIAVSGMSPGCVESVATSTIMYTETSSAEQSTVKAKIKAGVLFTDESNYLCIALEEKLGIGADMNVVRVS
ncbi:MAG: hypothetical protein ABL921_21850, partial [Pirellula sp.]